MEVRWIQLKILQARALQIKFVGVNRTALRDSSSAWGSTSHQRNGMKYGMFTSFDYRLLKW